VCIHDIAPSGSSLAFVSGLIDFAPKAYTHQQPYSTAVSQRTLSVVLGVCLSGTRSLVLFASHPLTD